MEEKDRRGLWEAGSRRLSYVLCVSVLQSTGYLLRTQTSLRRNNLAQAPNACHRVGVAPEGIV